MPRLVKKIFLEFLGPYILCSGKCKTNCDDLEKEDEEKVVIECKYLTTSILGLLYSFYPFVKEDFE